MPKLPTSPPGRHAEFAGRLRRALNESGLSPDTTTRDTIAARWDISASMVSDMLNGRKLPKVENWVKIAVDLNVSIDWLLTGRGPMRVQEAAKDGMSIEHLPPDAQAAIRALVHSIEHGGNTKKGR